MKPALPQATDPAQYLISDGHEIDRILRELLHSRGLITAYADNGGDFVLSRITGLEPESGDILMDCGEDEAANARLANSRAITLCASLQGVSIQFETDRPRLTQTAGRRAWRLRRPRQVLRLQRRAFYRLTTSLVQPIRCLINTGRGPLQTTVMDISVGGIAILAYEDDGTLKADQVFRDCSLRLPDAAGEIRFNLRVINTFDLRLKNGRLSHRAGCQFVDLPPSAETEIQRFILKTERERRSRYV
jgi:c-di-GMP-binding flagellar brake protein YcgR